jgi:outer membrane murein-binding lipoprotein Lpp
MKKIVILVLSAVMAVIFLSGCESAEEKQARLALEKIIEECKYNMRLMVNEEDVDRAIKEECTKEEAEKYIKTMNTRF